MIDRRDFLEAVFSGCLAGWSAACGRKGGARITPTLLDTDEASLLEYASDWGNIVEAIPAVVSRPATPDLLRESFTHAARNGMKVAFRGGGQSFLGQSLCERGMVIDMRALVADAGGPVVGDGWVSAPAGMLLHDLLRLLQERSLRLPVYTTAPRATVGGTLSAGGISGRSFTRGQLVHGVLEVELMGTDGREWRCGPESDPEIFSCALAAMGSTGALLRVKLRTEPLLRERVQLVLTRAPVSELTSLCDLFSTMPEVVSMEGFLSLAGTAPMANVFATIEARDGAEVERCRQVWQGLIQRQRWGNAEIRTRDVDSAMEFSASLGGWGSLGQDVLTSLTNRRLSLYLIPLSLAVPRSVALGFLEEVAGIHREYRRFRGLPPYFSMIRTISESPLLLGRLSNESDYALGLDYWVRFRSSERDGAMAVLNEVARVVAAHGGRVYPYAFIPENAAALGLVPTSLDSVAQVLERTDPEGLLRPPFSFGLCGSAVSSPTGGGAP